MDWSTVYANALAQMLNEKNLAGGSGTSRGDIITLPQHRSTVSTTTLQQQPAMSDAAEMKPAVTSQLKTLLQTTQSQQSSSSQRGSHSANSILQSTDLLTAALHSQSPNHTLTLPGGGATSNSQTRVQSTSPSHIPSFHSAATSPGK